VVHGVERLIDGKQVTAVDSLGAGSIEQLEDILKQNKSMLRIRDVYPGFRIQIFSSPDP
jgi:anti-anti-sigma regulatory factor